MSDFVKETMKRLLKEHGDSFFSDVNRLKGFLYDICPSFRKEVVAIIAVVQEGLIAEIKRGNLMILNYTHFRPVHTTPRGLIRISLNGR